MSSLFYVPSQVPLLHEGVAPEQGSAVPHLHDPAVVSQVSVAPEHPESSVHSAIEKK